MIHELKDLSNSELVTSFKKLKVREDELLVEVLQHLAEIERRRLFLTFGYTSLFGYLTQGIGYSENEAYRRIESARLLNANPEIKEDVQKGNLTLATMTDAAVAIRTQEKFAGKKLSKPDKLDLLAQVCGKSRREAQKTLATSFPDSVPQFEERKRERNDGSLELTLLFLPDQRRRLENARDILAHKGPVKSTTEVIDQLSDYFLRRKNLTQGFDPGIETVHHEKSVPNINVRAISIYLRRAVFRRDAGKCQFKLERGKICGSTYQIELDHTVPVSKGGRSTYMNLRCLCRVHNQWKSDELELENPVELKKNSVVSSEQNPNEIATELQ